MYFEFEFEEKKRMRKNILIPAQNSFTITVIFNFKEVPDITKRIFSILELSSSLTKKLIHKTAISVSKDVREKYKNKIVSIACVSKQ